MRASLLISFALLAACQAARAPAAAIPVRTSSAQTAEPSVPTLPGPHLVVRDLDLFEQATAGRERLVAHIQDGELVDRGDSLEHDAVRVRTAVATFEGFLRFPEHLASRQGVGLYAQREADVVSPGAEELVLGHVRPGAFVTVDSIDGRWATVSLAPFGARGRVDAGALAAARVDLRPAATSPESLDNRSFRLRLIDGQKVDSSCSAPVAWRTEDAGLRVTQEIDGVAVSGSATLDPGTRCPARVWRDDAGDIPDGYRRLDVHAAILDRPATLYWIDDGDDGGGRGLSCVDWQYRPPGGPSGEGELRTRTTESGVNGATTWTVSFVVRAEGGVAPGSRLALLGPRAVGRDTKGNVTAETTGLCAERLTIAGRDQDGVVVLPNVAASPHAILAYHPDDARTWYLSRPACERQLARIRAKAEPRLFTLARLGPLGC